MKTDIFVEDVIMFLLMALVVALLAGIICFFLTRNDDKIASVTIGPSLEERVRNIERSLDWARAHQDIIYSELRSLHNKNSINNKDLTNKQMRSYEQQLYIHGKDRS